MTKSAPSLALARLAVRLRRLRRAAGLTKLDVSRAVPINRTTLHRIERAASRPYQRTLDKLLTLYGAPEDTCAELRALRDAARPARVTGSGHSVTETLAHPPRRG